MGISTTYSGILLQLQGLFEGEKDTIANLSNASAVLMEQLDRLNWAGFYILKEGMLVLGPFQGKAACIRISLGKGVCGTAVVRRETVLVPDVHAFPGHIACDGASRSEIVVPLFQKDRLVGVLDLDSPVLDRFTAEDQEGLEAAARIIQDACRWTDVTGRE